MTKKMYCISLYSHQNRFSPFYLPLLVISDLPLLSPSPSMLSPTLRLYSFIYSIFDSLCWEYPAVGKSEWTVKSNVDITERLQEDLGMNGGKWEVRGAGKSSLLF